MLSTKTMPAALAALVILGAAPAVAAAHEHEDQAELAALQNAKVSLTDAIRTAEQQVSGKALDAGLENHDGKLRYEVKVLKDGAVQKVMVDAQSGQIVTASAGKTHEDENGAEQEQQNDGDQED